MEKQLNSEIRRKLIQECECIQEQMFDDADKWGEIRFHLERHHPDKLVRELSFAHSRLCENVAVLSCTLIKVARASCDLDLEGCFDDHE